MILKLDIDEKRTLRMADVAGRLARANKRLLWLAQRRSPSGRGWHMWLSVSPAPVTAMECVALQLLLGSDPRREAYNLNRARVVDAGGAPPNMSWNVLYGCYPATSPRQLNSR